MILITDYNKYVALAAELSRLCCFTEEEDDDLSTFN